MKVVLIKKGDATTPNGMNTYLFKGCEIQAYKIKDVRNRAKFLNIK
jgi:hypothetical protein